MSERALPTVLFDSSKYKHGRGYVLLPVLMPKVWELYKVVQADFWTAEDVLGLDNRVPDVPAAFVLSELVAAMRAGALPETMSVMFRDSEIASFLGFQAMEEHIHLEVAISLALPSGEEAEPERRVNPSLWPKPRSSDSSRVTGITSVVEYAATYAAAAASVRAFVAVTTGDSALNLAAIYIARDYERSYQFGLVLCAIVAASTKALVPDFLDMARGVVEAVTDNCQMATAQKTIVRAKFVNDLNEELTTFRLPKVKPANAAVTDEPLSMDESF